MPLRRLRLTLILCSAACVAAPTVPEAAPEAGVRPEEMFAGVTCGRGVLTHADGGAPRGFTVRSTGERVRSTGEEVPSAGEGTSGGFVLDQTIRFDDGERRERRWVLRADGPRRYRGTLTEASGPVRARVGGDTLTLAYPLAGVPLGRMEQTLTLGADGRVANTGTARVAGVPVRRLSETITRGAGACAAMR